MAYLNDIISSSECKHEWIIETGITFEHCCTYSPLFSLMAEGHKVKLVPVTYVTCSGDSFADLTSDTEAKAQDSNAFADHHRKVWSFASSQNLPANTNKMGNVCIM
jgi:hypothetical protein